VAALILAAFASQRSCQAPAGRFPGLDGLSPPQAGHLALASLTLAALLGVLLQLIGQTGDLTIPLGSLGALGGYFFFAPPLKWGRRGWGEAVGGLCFGLLPVAAGFYLQCGHFITEVLIYGLPLTFAAFNLFLIQGFPSPASGEGESRCTLAERLGPVAGALIYTLVNVLTIIGLLLGFLFPASPLPFRHALLLLVLLAVVNQELIKRKVYREERGLRSLGFLTLTLHLGMGSVFVLMLTARM
jgi:1,4-dihydroxy-2-naphthoate octaprenyltransferase